MSYARLQPHAKLTKGQQLTFTCCKTQLCSPKLIYNLIFRNSNLILPILNLPTKLLQNWFGQMPQQLMIKKARPSLDGRENIRMASEQSSRNETRLSHLHMGEGFRQLTLKATTFPDMVQTNLVILLFVSSSWGHRTWTVSSFYKETPQRPISLHGSFIYEVGIVQDTKERKEDSFISLHKTRVGRLLHKIL